MRLALHWQILIGVVVAAVLGVFLNATVSERDVEVRLDERTVLEAHDSADLIEVVIREKDENGRETIRRWTVDPNATVLRRDYTALLVGAIGQSGTSPLAAAATVFPGRLPKQYPTLALFKENEPEVYARFHSHGRSLARWIGDWADALGQLFLRLLKMVAAPLIITSLMTGVLGLASAGRLRKLFSLTVLYYLSTSMLAICIGILMVNLIRPGETGAVFSLESEVVVAQADIGEVIFRQIERMIPTNPIQAVAQTEFLSIISFSLAFGVFTLIAGGKTLEFLRQLFEAGFDVMMKMTMAIIHLAPIGVFFLMLAATATQGVGIFGTLGWYMLTVFLALAVHATIVLPTIVALVGRRNPLQFAHAMSPALLTAFSSASSNATLPLTLSCVEERAGIPNRIGSFVLPLGATINMDGTALFEAIAVLFIAQLEPGVNLTLAQQFLVAFTALLASVGAAGIPHAGLVMMVIVLQAVGLPIDRVGLILAVDRILDMCRTSVNVWSDSCGCAVVARFDGGAAETEAAAESVAVAPAPEAT